MSRQLDAAIAEVLTGEKISRGDIIAYNNGMKYLNPRHFMAYSSDGNAMLELDREMQKRGYYLTIMNPHILNVLTGRVVEFAAIYQTLEQLSQYEYKECQAVVNFKGTETGKNEPLARALAAYKVLTGREWKEHD